MKYSYSLKLILIILLCQMSWATQYYLDAARANDTGAGTSWATAFKTLTHVVLHAKVSGDIVDVNTGTYTGGLWDQTSTVQTDWITYRPATGKTVSFDYVYLKNGTKYLRLQGINITPPSTQVGVLAYNTNYVDVNGCTLTGRGLANYKTSDLYDWGVKVSGATTNVTVNDCNVVGFKYGVAGINLTSTTPSYVYATNNVIHTCRFGVQAFGSYWYVNDNNIHDIGSDGILGTCTDSEFKHNVIHDLDRPASYSATGTFAYTAADKTIRATNGAFATWRTALADYARYIRITVSGTQHGAQINSWADLVNTTSITDANTIVLQVAIPSGAWSGYTGGNLTISNIEFTPNWHNDGIQLQHTNSQLPTYSPRPNNVLIDGNKIYNVSLAAGGGGQGFHSDTYEDSPYNNITLQNNLIYNVISLGYQINFSFANTRQTGWVFRNNVDYPSGGVWTGRTSTFKGTDFTIFSGNILGTADIFTTVSALNCAESPYKCDITYFEDNFVYDEWWGNTCKATSAGFPASNVVLSKADFNDLFTNVATNDFTLATGSAAINDCNALYSPITDILKALRDAQPDAGAYEANPNPDAPTNAPPVLDAIGAKSVAKDVELTFDVNASDPNVGDTLTYTVVDLPTGATFVTKTFTWTPAYPAGGIYYVTFVVSDSKDTDSEQVAITVTNQAPVLSFIADQIVNEGEALTFTISATDADTGDVLTYSAGNLPSGATFTPATKTFTWTPNYNQSGSYSVTFNVTDQADTASQIISIIVVNVGVVVRPEGYRSRWNNNYGQNQ